MTVQGISAVLLVAGGAVAGIVVPARAATVFGHDFESGTLASGTWGTSPGWDYSSWDGYYQYQGRDGRVIDEDGHFAARSGEKMHEARLFYTDKANGVVRSEIKKSGFAGVGSTIWWGFSVYVPTTWGDDNVVFSNGQRSSDIVHQVFSPADPGDVTRSPILSLSIVGNGPAGHAGSSWSLTNRWDARAVSADTAGIGSQNWGRSSLGDVEKGVWTDWVFNMRMDYDNDGYLRVWKNDVRVASRIDLPNAYNDDGQVWMKYGIYKPSYDDDSPPSRFVYHDEIRIGNYQSSYADVEPRGAIALPEPGGLTLIGAAAILARSRTLTRRTATV